MPDDASARKKRCFVVMGFGLKTDLATGRELDLDKSYRLLIKPVVQERGLECVRADEIRHTGIIDVPMYRELLTADVVTADLSTANPNALYELGIRHALRPRTTIVISEDKLTYPFDLNHVLITRYTHLGKALDYDEVERFRKTLGETLDAVLTAENPDSPVYTFLKLTPPVLDEQTSRAIEAADEALGKAGEAIASAAAEIPAPAPDGDNPTLAWLVQQGEKYIGSGRFAEAAGMFRSALELCDGPDPREVRHDPYLTQRLALATYKAKQPDDASAVAALNAAMKILAPLGPEESNDPETVGLAGAIEKRLFERGQGTEHLNRAISYYERGYVLRDDWYNGINLAFLLNVRADTPLDDTDQERIADLVWANRIRREVLVLAREDLEEIRHLRERAESKGTPLAGVPGSSDREQEFWCLATRAEAFFGLGEMDRYRETREEATKLGGPDWWLESLDGQIEKLRPLLERHGHLLSPPWPVSGGAA